MQYCMEDLSALDDVETMHLEVLWMLRFQMFVVQLPSQICSTVQPRSCRRSIRLETVLKK